LVDELRSQDTEPAYVDVRHADSEADNSPSPRPPPRLGDIDFHTEGLELVSQTLSAGGDAAELGALVTTPVRKPADQREELQEARGQTTAHSFAHEYLAEFVTPGGSRNQSAWFRYYRKAGVQYRLLAPGGGWDHHQELGEKLPLLAKETDQGAAALVADLKRRGLLDDTLVIWGGEFGRTTYCQGPLTATKFGRDHHPHCFTIWMAGGGIRSGLTYGATDDFGYNVADKPVHVHDFQATLLHCLGIDHTKLTYRFQGRDSALPTCMAGW
jgi:hypothetical protein